MVAEYLEKGVTPELEIPMHLDILSNTFLNSRKRNVQIDRPIYRENDLTQLYNTNEKKEKTLFIAYVRNSWRNCFSRTCLISTIFSLIPVLTWLPKYNIKTDLVRDMAAGLTLGIIQIPQGMAYGMLTTLPAIYGLYSSFVPVFIYFIFGSSKHANIGTFAIICLMVGEMVEGQVSPLLTVLETKNNGTLTQDDLNIQEVNLRIQYSVTAAFLVGVLQVAFGFLKFGFITIFLSDPLISGFTTGAAFHIFSSQVKHLVGMKIPREEIGGIFGLFKLYIYIFEHITSVNYGSLIIGVVAAVLLYAIKFMSQKYQHKIKVPVPAELIIVILGASLSYGLEFNRKYEIAILQDVPTGMPPLTVPEFSKMGAMFVDCISIAIVSYAISISIAKAFAKKNKYEVNPNQELLAHGASNMIGSFFSCHVVSLSLSRSLIQESLGKTQLATVFSCVLILLTLTVLAPLFKPLPNAILAAIVLIALKGLFKQFTVLKALTKISKIDAFVWVSSFVAVFCLGVDYGLAVGLFINLLTTVVKISRPSKSILGHVKNTEIYATITPGSESSLEQIPGVKIFQFHAPLIYVNVDHFQSSLFKATANPATCVSAPVPMCYQDNEKMVDENGGDTFYMQTDEDDVGKNLTDTQATTKDPLLDKSSLSANDTTSVCLDASKNLVCPLHTIILDCSQISYADTMGIGILVSVCSEFKNLNVDIHLSNTPDQLFTLLEVGGFIEMHGSDNIFVTLHDAVQYSLAKHHVAGVFDSASKPSKEELVYDAVVPETEKNDTNFKCTEQDPATPEEPQNEDSTKETPSKEHPTEETPVDLTVEVEGNTAPDVPLNIDC